MFCVSDDFIGYLQTFFLLIHKIVPLSGREKLYISNQRYENLSNCKVPDLTAVSLVSFHQELVRFWKIKKYFITWYRISPSSKGRSHHNYVDSGHGRVRKFDGRAANLCWLSEDNLTNLNCTSFQGELNYFKRIIVSKVRDVRAVSLHHL